MKRAIAAVVLVVIVVVAGYQWNLSRASRREFHVWVNQSDDSIYGHLIISCGKPTMIYEGNNRFLLTIPDTRDDNHDGTAHDYGYSQGTYSSISIDEDKTGYVCRLPVKEN